MKAGQRNQRVFVETFVEIDTQLTSYALIRQMKSRVFVLRLH